MQLDDFDRFLAVEDKILPSAGFSASLMEVVRREAATPPPIPFPWKTALPGIGAALTVLVCILLAFGYFVRTSAQEPNSAAMPVLLLQALQTSIHFGLGWVALSLLLSLVAMVLSMRLTTASPARVPAGWGH
jgi:hypothetical protein